MGRRRAAVLLDSGISRRQCADTRQSDLECERGMQWNSITHEFVHAGGHDRILSAWPVVVASAVRGFERADRHCGKLNPRCRNWSSYALVWPGGGRRLLSRIFWMGDLPHRLCCVAVLFWYASMAYRDAGSAETGTACRFSRGARQLVHENQRQPA